MEENFREQYEMEFLHVSVPESDKFASYRVISPNVLRFFVPCLMIETLVTYDHKPEYYQHFLARIQQHTHEGFARQVETLLHSKDRDSWVLQLHDDGFILAIQSMIRSIGQSLGGRLGHWIYEILSQYLNFNVYVYQEAKLEHFSIFDYHPDAPTLYILESEEYFIALTPRDSQYQKIWQSARIEEALFLSGMMDEVSPQLIRSVSESSPEEFRKSLDSLEEVSSLSLEQLLEMFQHVPEQTVKQIYDEAGHDIDLAIELLMTVPQSLPKSTLPPVPSSLLEDLGHYQQLDPEVFQDIFRQYQACEKASQRFQRLAINAQNCRNFQEANRLRYQAQQSKKFQKQYYDIIHLEQFKQKNPNLLAADQIDLHFLRVPEAVQIVREFVELCIKERRPKATIITGRGNHSYAGIPLIKGAVQEWLRNNGIPFQPAPGHLTIHFSY